jgi:hypothetical protein
MRFHLSEFSPSRAATDLVVDDLEPRQMLSSVQVYATGATGEETFDLVINNEVVRTAMISDRFGTGEFKLFGYSQVEDIDVRDVRVTFTNDGVGFDGVSDRNLIVDRIVIDGETFETEHPLTWSANNFFDGEIQSGRFQTETLFTNGSFRYSPFGKTVKTRVRIDAFGSTGDEELVLRIDGKEVARYQVGTESQPFFFLSGKELEPGNIRIEFVNDLFDPDNGIDRNLTVASLQLIDIDSGERIREAPTSSTVLSTGTWLSDGGIAPGFGRGDTLHANGYFQFGGGDLDRIRREAIEDEFVSRNPDGRVFFEFLPNDFIDPAGREYFIATAWKDQAQTRELFLVRYLPNGNIDRSFGDNGFVLQPLELIPGNDQQAFVTGRPASLAFADNGDVAVLLNVTAPRPSVPRVSSTQWIGTEVIRLDSSGNRDSSFGDNGRIFVPWSQGQTVSATDAAFDNNGQLLAIGKKVEQFLSTILGQTSGIADEISTLRLVEDPGGAFFVDVTG